MTSPSIPSQITAALDACHLDRAEVAKRAGIARGTLHNLERGRPVSTKALAAVARVLGLEVRLLVAPQQEGV